jgi:hypothetical protein
MAVGDTIYETLWYDRSKRYKELIPMILLRAQKPIRMNAGPIWTYSFAFCSQVRINWLWVY